MKRRRRLALEAGAIVAGLSGLLVGAYAFFERGCGIGSLFCESRIRGEYPSPDHKMKVVVFEWDCGATTGIAMEASVLAAGRKLPGGTGNVFATDDHWGEDPSVAGGHPVLGVKWLSDARVVLTYPTGTGVRQELSRYEGVDIEYETSR